MGQVLRLGKSDPMDDPATRAETYLDTALRNIKALREAISQVDDVDEQIRLRSGFLAIANEAIEGTVDGV